MTKNNLKVVKTDNKKQQELKEKNKSLEAAISQIDQNSVGNSAISLTSNGNNTMVGKEISVYLTAKSNSSLPYPLEL